MIIYNFEEFKERKVLPNQCKTYPSIPPSAVSPRASRIPSHLE